MSGNQFHRICSPSSTEPKFRLAVLSTLHERFDKHLAQAENVRSLFIALNDEHFENRMVAVGLIGRLALHNPAYVMPSLRKALIQLLTELEYSTVMYAPTDCLPVFLELIYMHSQAEQRRMHTVAHAPHQCHTTADKALCNSHASSSPSESLGSKSCGCRERRYVLGRIGLRWRRRCHATRSGPDAGYHSQAH